MQIKLSHLIIFDVLFCETVILNIYGHIYGHFPLTNTEENFLPAT